MCLIASQMKGALHALTPVTAQHLINSQVRQFVTGNITRTAITVFWILALRWMTRQNLSRHCASLNAQDIVCYAYEALHML